jgi:hypothetical protein
MISYSEFEKYDQQIIGFSEGGLATMLVHHGKWLVAPLAFLSR